MSEVLIALLSGAFSATCITVLYDYFKMKHQFKIDYVRKQIDHLYGPLNVILSHSSKSLENSEIILQAYDVYYSGNKWSHEESTQKSLNEDASRTIDISNEYVNIAANANNEKIFEIIMNNYSYIDLDDCGEGYEKIAHLIPVYHALLN